MKTLRENMVPVAILTVWMAASAYTVEALATMRPAPRVVAATTDMTVTAPVRATTHLACPDTVTRVTAGT